MSEKIIPLEQITLDLQPHAQQLFGILNGFRYQIIARDERIAELERENADYRRASEAVAAHRKALEQLVWDCLAHMYTEPEEIVYVVGRMGERGPITPDDYHLIIDDNWREVHLQLVGRFAELSTTPISELKSTPEATTEASEP